ncbi:acyltransferase family protein [Acinetobacter baumannii]|uniref:acyltransferase family protein n=1 Tax=Acinetobacter baumannii TaxID=470 RepID=UPI000D68D63E|nr:acyltransferase family protein [Acinetobacter baumannii]
MERNISLDILKIVLAFFIIALHGKLFSDVYPELSFYTVNGIFRIGVPVFLIITGFYFYKLKDLGVWLKRVFILYAIWMLVYSFFYFESPTSVAALAKDLFFLVFGYHHLWYLAGTLLGGIVLFFARNLPTKVQLFSALGLFILGVALQYIGNMHYFTGVVDKLLNFYPVHRNFLTVCYPFLMIGFLINKEGLIDKISNTRYFVPIAVAILYLEVFINFNFISKTEPLDGMFSLMLICPLLFILFSKINVTGSVKTIALFSTALYLIHPLFQNILIPYHVSTIISFGITVVLSLIASYILVMLNKRFNYLL